MTFQPAQVGDPDLPRARACEVMVRDPGSDCKDLAHGEEEEEEKERVAVAQIDFCRPCFTGIRNEIGFPACNNCMSIPRTPCPRAARICHSACMCVDVAINTNNQASSKRITDARATTRPLIAYQSNPESGLGSTLTWRLVKLYPCGTAGRPIPEHNRRMPVDLLHAYRQAVWNVFL